MKQIYRIYSRIGSKPYYCTWQEIVADLIIVNFWQSNQVRNQHANNHYLLASLLVLTLVNMPLFSFNDPVNPHRKDNTYIMVDTDGDGVDNTTDLDDDNDGILDTEEDSSCGLINFNTDLVIKNKLILSTTATTVGSIAVLKDGNLANSSFYYSGATQAVANKEYVKIDFQKKILLKGFELAVGGYVFANGTVMKVQGSNDNTIWTDLLTSTRTQAQPACIYGTCTIAETFTFASNTTPYRYYRLFGVSGTSRQIPYVQEIFFDVVAYSPCDIDGDGLINSLDLDSDNDGIPDNVEAQPTLTYISPNSDLPATYATNNGVNSAYLGGINPANTDNDLCEDYLDEDSDNDGVSDKLESGLTFNGMPGTNGLDSGSEVADTYADVNGVINDPKNNLSSNNPGVSEVKYRERPPGMYFIASSATPNFQKLEVGPAPMLAALPAWTRPTGGTDAPVIGSVGDIVYVQQVNATSVMLRYRISTNAWLTPNLTVTGGTSRNMYTDGTNLFQWDLAGQGLRVFNSTTNTFTVIAPLNVSYTSMCSGVGNLYYTRTSKLWKYNHSTGIITDLGALPVGQGSNYICSDANNVYVTDGDTNDPIGVYSIAGASWSTRPTLNNLIQNGFGSDGTYLYAKSGANVWQYPIANLTGTWTQIFTNAISGGSFPKASMAGSYFIPVPTCAAPVVTATATSPTCTGTTANSNGTLTLTAFNANATKVGYSIGSTYTGPAFASATTISGAAPFTVVNTLSNPAFNQPYTIRIFCDATTFTDKTVILAPKQCSMADLSVSISPATQTGNVGETLTYTVTLANAGPNPATNVVVSVPIPIPTATLLSAVGASGSYDSITKKWTVPNLPVGSTTLTFSLQVN